MAVCHLIAFLLLAVFSASLGLQTLAFTDPLDATTLHGLYAALNYPAQLKGWRPDGGDPCGESWAGVACSGSSVIYLKLDGLNLSGSLGDQLYNFHNLKQLDMSSNNIQGDIPYGLPPNVTHLNLACNKLIQSIPHSLPSLKSLRHLNLSHNLLSGPIGNVFVGLLNLKEMDLSNNNFTGDLPSSFQSLTNLTGLFLQNNGFTGAVILLANLPLIDLDIQDNHFSGVIPESFQNIPNLWIGGNKFHGAESPPWNFPFQNMSLHSNISSPPTTQSSAVENYPSRKPRSHKKGKWGPGGIACIVGGGTLVASCAALLIVILIHRARAQEDKLLDRSNISFNSVSLRTVRESPPILPCIPPPPTVRARPVPLALLAGQGNRKSFSRKCEALECVKIYNAAELQFATKGFGEENLIFEGSLGPVYEAKLPDGQILAVENINMASLSLHEEEQFLDVICTICRLRHPNIIPLLGYCTGLGLHLLVYEYVRHVTLEDALHGGKYKPLSWSSRVRIALGVAQALDYMHSTFAPPISHGNLKARNILLDEEVRPRICDCGVSVLRPLTSCTVKLKASEIAIGDSGYIAPEHGQPGIDNTKCDIYAFGVLLLELLTGRRPFDSSRPREELYLVNWASYQLHDRDCLEQMVDKSVEGTLSFRALSRLADIIAVCIRPEKEFRPAMCEVVESLLYMVERMSITEGNATYGGDLEPYERSFRSTHTRFLASPATSSWSSDPSSQ
ncbi:protein STRUBBELIG-RECEPTOR FAMILY 2 isoform X2 [Rhodamnia argentea]|uniref:Protein STRUBBELIG-RECEPTOR FAMILY 2 isoform X2 n=1 Tax=Rhodamnia argentea TaxID=178133 RepID=A0ABM3HZN9_9MYRT|nr:protein STRUBBELIG-RECEPTOR FAMILY 2 isoform X2 [Rhodamnia argentea]